MMGPLVASSEKGASPPFSIRWQKEKKKGIGGGKKEGKIQHGTCDKTREAFFVWRSFTADPRECVKGKEDNIVPCSRHRRPGRKIDRAEEN